MSALPLLIITREGEAQRSQSIESEISIGRGEGNVVRLEDRAVSRKHALIRSTSEGVQIERQSDFAPIRLNGIECTRALIREGDVVEIGPFRMRLDAKKEAAKPVTREVPVAPAPVAALDDRTVVLPDEEMQTPEAMPTESTHSVLGDLSAALSIEGAEDAASLATPIEGDAVGADAASADPGTDIFANPNEAPLELNIDFNTPAVPEAAGTGTVEISTEPFDENAATRVLKSASVDARLQIASGLANVEQLDLKKEEISIGRGKECDLVLNDKKSSRKNATISRVGNRYILKDLGSSNGTYLNGASIREAELSGDDVIRIGDVEIAFVALNADYEKKKDRFLPVDQEQQVQPVAEPQTLSGIVGTPIDPNADFGIPENSQDEAAPQIEPRKGLGGLIDKYFRNFGTLKPVQKLLVVLCVGLFLSWYFEDELGLGEPPKPKQRVVQKTADGKAVLAKDYDSLTPEQKQQVDEAIRRATDFHKIQDYDRAINELKEKVYSILPDFGRAKEIERYAQEGKRRKAAIEEEARKKEEEQKLKDQIAAFEEQARSLMAKKQYEQAKEIFGEILTLDPDNASVADWKQTIDAWSEEQARILQEKQVQEEINKRAWDTYNEGFALHKVGKYREAIELYKKVPELGTDDKILLKKSQTMIKASQDSIRELRDPHLKKAKESEQAGDLGAAFREYQTATEVDPQHPEGWSGMDRIRDVLTERAKIIYTEAVIAESYSDFKTANAKFKEILKLAPEGSLYHQRATRKLQSYLNFKSDDEAESE